MKYFFTENTKTTNNIILTENNKKSKGIQENLLNL